MKGQFATEEGRVAPIVAERKHQNPGLTIVVTAEVTYNRCEFQSN